MHESAVEILSPNGPIAKHLQGFEPRPQQLQMAAAVEAAMRRQGTLLVEAGTGVGKSFAYLVPAIIRAVEPGERVVIATHTIALQEQLIDKDIPLLRQALPHEFTAVLVKGRGNYLSLRRLMLASERSPLLFQDPDQLQALQIIEDWAYETTDGTLATLPQLPRAEVWDRVQSDAENCMGRKCPTYDKCFYQQARRSMERANILICNHAIFFADLALRGCAPDGHGFLPDYRHVILDEAHNVEDVACEHFGLSLPEARVKHLLSILYSKRGRGGRADRARGFLASLSQMQGAHDVVASATDAVLTAREACDEFCTGVLRWAERISRRPNTRPEESLSVRIRSPREFANPLSDAMSSLADLLDAIKQSAPNEEDAFELNAYVNRARGIAQATTTLVDQTLIDSVYWVEVQTRRSAAEHAPPSRHVTLAAAPVDVSGTLRQRLFRENLSVTLTSATLTTGKDDFSHLVTRLGCPENAEKIIVGSPFDFARQVRLIIESDLPEPGEPGYEARLADRIAHHLHATNGGAFVLFTSFATLRDCATRLRTLLANSRVPALPLIVHGEEGPRGLLLRRFRETPNAVLLGTASFWQGVDVRGDTLRNVIITRLPFDPPDQPLVEARAEKLRSHGTNPFLGDALPRAIIRFKQGFGRLIRSRSDTGRVVILDSRIRTKPYGKQFLNSLPEGVRPAAI